MLMPGDEEGPVIDGNVDINPGVCTRVVGLGPHPVQEQSIRFIVAAGAPDIHPGTLADV
jgi:hypothetical protein